MTLSIVTGITGAVRATTTGVVFLLGTAATFALVAVLPGGASPRWWAWIPAGVLTLSAIAVLATAAEWYTVLNVLWPLAVIAAGAFLTGRAIQRRRQPGDDGDSGPDAASHQRADGS